MDRKLANAVVGTSARACDSCVRKRARWYCAADDAFLCQTCDSSVHSPNPMARRHQRVRLKMGSICAPSWHEGFTRKSRTPRQKKNGCRPVCSGGISNNSSPVVPEIGDTPPENDDHILLQRVPDFDSLFDDAEFSQEIDLAEFESFLGDGMEDAWFEMEGLGLPESSIEGDVKIENEEDTKPMAEQTQMAQELECTNTNYVYDPKKIFLSLDYKGVISAWDDKKCPWTNGERPDLNSWGECWPYCSSGRCGGTHGLEMDGGREARVMRYREKRRTRLFSKKIRYQVRKLNADKRPRIKGRFVKTPIFMLHQSPLLPSSTLTL